MAKARFVHDGKSIDYTPGSDVSAGDIVIQGDLVGISKLDIAAGALGALATEGIFDIVKEGGGGVTFAIGDEVFWDADNSVAVATAAGNTWLGYCVIAAVDADTAVRTRLNPGGELPTSAHIADVAAITASDPAAVTAGAAAITQGTYTAKADFTDPPTKAEIEAELALVDAELDKVKVDIAAAGAEITKAVTDLGVIRAEVVKLVADVTADKAKVNALLAALEGLGLLAAS